MASNDDDVVFCCKLGTQIGIQYIGAIGRSKVKNDRVRPLAPDSHHTYLLRRLQSPQHPHTVHRLLPHHLPPYPVLRTQDQRLAREHLQWMPALSLAQTRGELAEYLSGLVRFSVTTSLARDNETYTFNVVLEHLLDITANLVAPLDSLHIGQPILQSQEHIAQHSSRLQRIFIRP